MALWTPAYIPANLWLDASDSDTVTVVSDKVSQWRDKSVNANHAAEATLRPSYISEGLNGKNLVRFNVTNNKMVLGTGINMLGKYLYVVAKNNSTSVTGNIFSHSSTNCQIRFNGGGTFGLVGSPTTWGNLNSTGLISGYNIIGIVGITRGEIWFDGVRDVVSTVDQTANITYNQFGRRGTSTAEVLQGDICEVIIETTGKYRTKIEGYLAHKWGLTGNLAASHPYKTDAPTTIWTPADLTTALWLDGSDSDTITLDVDDKVEQWDDKSGNLRHATNTTTSNRPVVNLTGINSSPVIDFTGSAKALFVSSGFITDAFSAFIVHSGGGENERLIDQRSTGDFGTVKGFQIKGRNSTLDSAGVDDGSGRWRSRSGTDAGSTDAIQRAIIFPSSGNLDLYLNGSAYGTTSNGGTLPTDINNTGLDICIGGNAAGGTTQDFTGLIAEIVLISTALNTTDRQRVEGYLAHKWGLEGSLPADHPYRYLAPGEPLLDLLPHLWLDADASETITLDVSDNVEEWDDKSGKSNHFTQVESGRRPDKISGGVYFENEANVASTDPADFKYLLGDTVNVLKGPVLWIYAIVSPKYIASVPVYSALLASGSAVNRYHAIAVDSDGFTITARNTASYHAIKTITYEADKKYLLVAKYTATNNRSIDVDESGSPATHTTNSTTPTPTVTYLGLLRTPSTGNPGYGWSGLLSEILIFDSALSAESHALVVDYLTTKWEDAGNIELAGDIVGVSSTLDIHFNLAGLILLTALISNSSQVSDIKFTWLIKLLADMIGASSTESIRLSLVILNLLNTSVTPDRVIKSITSDAAILLADRSTGAKTLSRTGIKTIE